jgi:hypothetical protein
MNWDHFWLTDDQFSKIEHARQGAGGRSSGDQRDYRCVEVRRSLDRRSAGIRAEENPLQPLCPLGGKRRLGRLVPRACAGRRAARASLARQLRREGPSLGFGRRRGEKNQAIGRSRGGRTTKIHPLTDAECRPLSFTLTGGQVADCRAGAELLARLPPCQINVIERMFCRLKDFRRVATRYDRNAANFLAAVCIAATVSYWL